MTLQILAGTDGNGIAQVEGAQLPGPDSAQLAASSTDLQHGPVTAKPGAKSRHPLEPVGHGVRQGGLEACTVARCAATPEDAPMILAADAGAQLGDNN